MLQIHQPAQCRHSLQHVMWPFVLGLLPPSVRHWLVPSVPLLHRPSAPHAAWPYVPLVLSVLSVLSPSVPPALLLLSAPHTAWPYVSLVAEPCPARAPPPICPFVRLAVEIFCATCCANPTSAPPSCPMCGAAICACNPACGVAMCAAVCPACVAPPVCPKHGVAKCPACGVAMYPTWCPAWAIRRICSTFDVAMCPACSPCPTCPAIIPVCPAYPTCPPNGAACPTCPATICRAAICCAPGTPPSTAPEIVSSPAIAEPWPAAKPRSPEHGTGTSRDAAAALALADLPSFDGVRSASVSRTIWMMPLAAFYSMLGMLWLGSKSSIFKNCIITFQFKSGYPLKSKTSLIIKFLPSHGSQQTWVPLQVNLSTYWKVTQNQAVATPLQLLCFQQLLLQELKVLATATQLLGRFPNVFFFWKLLAENCWKQNCLSIVCYWWN